MNKWTNISDKTDSWNNIMNANAIVGCKYCTQHRQFNVHIYLLKHRFNQKVNGYSLEKYGAYYALKGHTAQAKEDHLDRVH
jgi:hypothetical protein